MDPVVQLVLVIGICLSIPACYIIVALLLRERDDTPVIRTTPFDPSDLAARLEVEASFFDGAHRLTGDRDGRRWAIALKQVEGVWGATIDVSCSIPSGVRVRPEGFFGGKDPDLGDPAFDSLVDLQGDAAWLSAAFSARARADLLALQGRGGYRLERERVLAAAPRAAAGSKPARAAAHVDSDGSDIVRALEVAVRLAAALHLEPEQLPGALLARSRESAGDVGRLAALRLLAAFPESPEARQLVGSGGRLDGDPAFVAMSKAVTAPATAEPRIINLLGHREIEVRRAAITWLESCGTADAVQALRDSSTGQLKQPVREAVRAIQARVAHVDAGSLALVDDPEDAGRLALADDEAGRLALARARKEPGQ